MKGIETCEESWNPCLVLLLQFYNQWLSLLGTGFCAVVMFLIQWDVALATFAVVIILYLYVSYRRPGQSASCQCFQFYHY